MLKLLFLDTETTGAEVGRDRLCQLCYKNHEGFFQSLFKPPLPISIKAMSITHITNEMVADKEAFQESELYRSLKALLRDHVLIAHNAPFDVAMLEVEGIAVPQHICTLRVAQYLDKEDSIPEYKLQYLRYYLDINVPGAIAHDASGDVLVLEALFSRLLKKMIEETGDEDAAIKKMIEVSKNPFRTHTITFGKYRGTKLRDLAQKDPGYLDWLLGQKQADAKKNPNDEQIKQYIFSLKYYLGRS